MKRNPWPIAIAIYFALFITAMTSWIIFAVRNNHELVRADYYEHELKFQAEIDSLSRAAAADRVRVTYDSVAQRVNVALPEGAQTAGVEFYRPSNASLDRRLSIRGAQQSIDVGRFEPGLWKLRFSWSANSVEYRHDETLVIVNRSRFAAAR